MSNQILASDEEELVDDPQEVHWMVLPQPQEQFLNCVHYAFRDAIADDLIGLEVVADPNDLIVGLYKANFVLLNHPECAKYAFYGNDDQNNLEIEHHYAHVIVREEDNEWRELDFLDGPPHVQIRNWEHNIPPQVLDDQAVPIFYMTEQNAPFGIKVNHIQENWEAFFPWVNF